ncbi:MULTISPECIES: two-component system response regulator CreB [Pseudoxanthomonas]|uniref:Two-component system catabolic regulation response regulator CreB n=1 Tax=Pseudoxanthomonas winnipegensis TaxID=2480810 RepID=A0AAW8GA96_9GAMM|nr:MULTISPECIES: two-component system response regulator CreB [Pseudoxanthomonas]MDQ1119113.1 two-component system catabolic regulation response regulator CreB [Pseudoxanthomonas winnipegensis]MDQ1132302.1 two-component system catabolic regulation response regulator CreB [Pseudoxanthomonas winnipegensis]MDR6137685.1 two-component system catabolic regulation response regulator CreB [Pseudoxanthomonas sp. SORGH_AS_0997]
MLRGMPKVLVVEDEPAIADAVLYALRSEGLQAEHVALAREVAPRVRGGGIDVVVLDVGLPDGSGFEVCRQLRAFSQVPVLFLTARNDEIDCVLGLELGADDYVAKPFSPRELVARVRARLRRPASAAPTERAQGAFSIDDEGHRIRFRDQPLDLTRYEYALLAALLQRPGAILSRAQLMDRGWDRDADSADRTVDTHIKTLRAKLRAAGAQPDPVRTHRGLGYSLEL